MADISMIRKLVERTECTDSGCWEWIGCVQGNGYGRIRASGATMYAHRVSYSLFVGEIPEGMDVCHSCDNRRCVNPKHLFAGTRKDNMADAVAKSRQARGAMLPHSKLSEEAKREIVQQAKAGVLYKDIAAKYGVTRHSVGRVAIENGIRRHP